MPIVQKSRYEKIKNKISKIPKKVDCFFSCTSPVNGPCINEFKNQNSILKEEIVEKPKKIKNRDWIASYLAQKKRYEDGKLKKDKHIRKFLRAIAMSGCEVPEELKDWKPTPKVVRARKLKDKRHKVIYKSYSRCPQDYRRYIKSTFWEARRNNLFKEVGRICCICNSKSYIVVHHLRYIPREFGNEPNSDLAVLCQTCHTDFHNMYGVSKDRHNEFAEFAKIKVTRLL